MLTSSRAISIANDLTGGEMKLQRVVESDDEWDRRVEGAATMGVGGKEQGASTTQRALYMAALLGESSGPEHLLSVGTFTSAGFQRSNKQP